MTHFLHQMFNPESIAVFGASGPMNMGTMQASAIIGGGFPGKVYFIHPTKDEVLGQRTYKRVTEIEGKVDFCLITIPSSAVPGVLEDMGQKGIRNAVITTAGFNEIGTREGLSLNNEIKTVAKKHGIRFVGPNCLGLVNSHLPLNTTTFEVRPPVGGLSIASHSGSYTTQIFPYLETLEPGLGLRYVVSLGNESDVDVVDALEFFREDEKTKVVGLYVEGIRRGPEFMKAARETSRVKPVVVHYVGGNEAGARAGASHTASMGKPDAIMDGLFRQCGIIPAKGIGEFFDFARVLSQAPPMNANRVAVITNSGGPGATAAYTCEQEGLEIPDFSPELKTKISRNMLPTAAVANPIDFSFDTDMTRFEEVTRLIINSDEVDAVLVYGLFASGFMESRRKTYNRFFPDVKMDDVITLLKKSVTNVAGIPGKVHKPLVMCSLACQNEDGFRIFTDAETPAYPTPERAARAIGALARYWAWRREIKEK